MPNKQNNFITNHNFCICNNGHQKILYKWTEKHNFSCPICSQADLTGNAPSGKLILDNILDVKVLLEDLKKRWEVL